MKYIIQLTTVKFDNRNGGRLAKSRRPPFENNIFYLGNISPTTRLRCPAQRLAC